MANEVNNEKETVISTVSRIEELLHANKKLIWGIIIAVAVVAAAVFAWYKLAYQPKKAEALSQMFKAEISFREGNYSLALKGDGNVLGFEEIINEYGTKAGKAVYLYAAVCELQIADSLSADAALGYLAKYSTSDRILNARALALKGDAYCAKADYAKAAAAFEKAAQESSNVFSAGYLLKAGAAYEALGKPEKALAAYKLVKDQYPQSIEAYDIDKYITRLEVR